MLKTILQPKSSRMHGASSPTKKRFYSKVANAHLSFGLPKAFSLNTALMFSEKVVDATDNLVSKVPIRQAIAKKIADEPRVRKVLWREISGVAQLEIERSHSLAQAAFPLGVDMSLDLGFSASSLLCYRFLKPAPEYKYNWQATSAQIEDHNALFPSSVHLALKMPIGYEIELRGSGKLLLSEGLSMTQGMGAGINAACKSSQTLAGEYSLTVMALDGHNKVRVTIATMNEEMAGLQLQLRAGMLGVTGLSCGADGLLKKVLEDCVKSKIDAIIKHYGSIVATMTKASLTKQSTVCCYDLDLSKPLAREAYERLFRLSPKLVDHMAMQEDAGITSVGFHENEKQSFQSVGFQAFSKNIWSSEIADIECDGMVLSPDASSAIYYEKTYAEKLSSIISGEQEIRWEGIEVICDNKKPQKYYRFYHEQLANIPMQQDVDNFFWFASKLGIKSSVSLASELIEMDGLSKFLSNIDDTRTKIEIFFTQAGVSKLQEADSNIGFSAFQKAHDHNLIPEEHQAYAHHMLEKYQVMQNSWWAWFGFRSSMIELVNEYEHKTGRSFDSDYYKFVKAKLFGDLLAKFCNAKNKKDVRNFFAYIGKSPDFEYRETLLALAAIAGRENILVHELSMSGGNITLESIDEGEIMHPRNHAKNLFSRQNQLLRE